MPEEPLVSEAIRDLLEEEKGPELEIYNFLYRFYNDAEERAKALTYLLSLELKKLRARAVDMGDLREVWGPCNAILDLLLESTYHDNKTLILKSLESLTKQFKKRYGSCL